MFSKLPFASWLPVPSFSLSPFPTTRDKEANTHIFKYVTHFEPTCTSSRADVSNKLIYAKSGGEGPNKVMVPTNPGKV